MTLRTFKITCIVGIYNLFDLFLSFRYRPPDRPQNDIALVRIKGDPLKFSSEMMPICLPPGPKFPDLRGVVYVAGIQRRILNYSEKKLRM